jgi:MFS family permease
MNAATHDFVDPRSRRYLVRLIILMGLLAIMDQYISMVKSTAVPYLLDEYGIGASHFARLESRYLIATFLVFALNGLNDLIGRKWAALVLILLMGLSCLAIVLYTPSIHAFMIFYTVAMFTTVSNMWSIAVSEESPAEKRATYVSIVYVIGLLPLQAILPPILVDTLGLDWRWMYGVMFIFMLPVVVLWFYMHETRRYQQIVRERRAGVRRTHILGLGVIDRRDIRYIALAAAIWLTWLIHSFLYIGWAGYFFMTVNGYSLTRWSLVLLATLIMAMLGGVAGGRLMDRIGRRVALLAGCVGLAFSTAALGFAQGPLLPVTAVITGFFASFSYTWIVVYVPEVFPTGRRGACMGWTTTIARVSYVAGPALAAVLLDAFPTMEWFWVITGSIMLLPIAVILLSHPYETRVRELEEIAVER